MRLARGKSKQTEFHETDYYARFGEQKIHLPAVEPEPFAPAGLNVSYPPPEVNEELIQELMDATMREGAGFRRQGPANLDVSFNGDWRRERVHQPLGLSDPAPTAPISRPLWSNRATAGWIPRMPFRGTGGNHLFGLKPVLSALLVIILCGFLGWGFIHWQSPQGPEILSTLQSASELQASGAYAQALEEYAHLRSLAGTLAPKTAAELAFYEGGAWEGIWRNNPADSNSFEEAAGRYREVAEKDPTELRLYGVEALLALAGLYEARGGAGSAQVEDLRKAREALETLIQEPAFKDHPVVHLGIPHRRLAELIRKEDPRRAIDLLAAARDSQRFLEEGLENLAIAHIYQDQLHDPGKAEECFEKVRRNPLATEEHRQTAAMAISRLRGTDVAAPDLMTTDLLETLPEVKVQ
jgi:hypothetical protein